MYDTVARKADHLISRSDWIDVESSASVKPIALKARDGLPLHGFLTLPAGSNGRNLPMVVMPHGGPFDVFDSGQYDRETQMLAAAGYAVLQVNFRGSGNYGRAHTRPVRSSGARRCRTMSPMPPAGQSAKASPTAVASVSTAPATGPTRR